MIKKVTFVLLLSAFFCLFGICVFGKEDHMLDEEQNAVKVSDGIKRIALTFDDGPSEKYTEKILSILDEYHVRATFFVVGSNVRMYPELICREIMAGHEVGNHTDTHPMPLNLMPSNQLSLEMQKAEDSIYEAADYRPHLFRPPGGACSSVITSVAEGMDYRIVLWTLDTRDWDKSTTRDHVVNEILCNVEDGSIILCHDYVVRPDSVTIDALKYVIPKLISQGYEFVTVSELLCLNQ